MISWLTGFCSSVSQRKLFVRDSACSTVPQGYRCHDPYSKLWGQYSPYFSLSPFSDISPAIPVGCNIIFAQALSRHGARYPTQKKTKLYAELIQRIQKGATSYNGEFAFLEDFKYELGADDMVPFGNLQMVNSGAKFYQRYRDLGRAARPFIRASDSERVVVSANKFIEGFQQSKIDDPLAGDKEDAPNVDVIIGEGRNYNNTLDHGRCDVFEDANQSVHPSQDVFLSSFAQPTLDRVNSNLPGANLGIDDIPSLMDLCSFHTVAITPEASVLSPFCKLFTETEWHHYDYYQTLGKYYKYGPGHSLGPAQGIGFVNELVSRLTNTPVSDSTNVNHTLDSDPATFPLELPLYADFSHDNTMVSIYSALGLFNKTEPLSNSSVARPIDTHGFSAAWIVPFGAVAYIEKMECDSTPFANEPYVRILLNDRVFPLQGCAVDALGRCRLDDFIAGLNYMTGGGNWNDCYAE